MDVNLEAVVSAVKQSKKYGDTSEKTIRMLAETAVRQHKKPKAAIKAVRAQLHSIMAPYLGDPDYISAAGMLDALVAAGDEDGVRDACQEILSSHLSTRERLPILQQFYSEIFDVTGKPSSLMDIACGLNPLSFLWMGLKTPVNYFAYDIHEPRIQFINHAFHLFGLPQLGKVQDVALDPPGEPADVALFLKEMPRFERNYHGRGRPLLDALDVRWLVVSYPTVSTHGGRNLTSRYRDFMAELVDGHDWPITELLFDGELVFCLDKGDSV